MGSRGAWAVAAILALAATACGGAQGGSGGVGWSSAIDAIPADAAWLAYMDFDANDAAGLEATADVIGQLSASGDETFAFFEAATGIDLSAPDALASTGMDLQGEVAVFATVLAPVLIVKLADVEAWSSMIEHLIDFNADATVTDVEVAGVALRHIAVDGAAVEIGAAGGYGVVRFLLEESSLNVSDEDFARALRGQGARGFADSAPAGELYDRAQQDERVASVWLARTSLVDDMFRFVIAPATAALSDDPSQSSYSDATTHARCRAAAERTMVDLPWFAGIEFRPRGAQGRTRDVMVARLGEEFAQRVAPAFGGAVAVERELVDPAAFYMTTDVNLRALVGAVQADAENAECRDLAAFGGLLATLIDGRQADIEYNLSFFDGGYGMALFDVRMLGFLPSVDALVMIGSDAPTSLFEYVQSALVDMGGTGTTNTSSPLTSITYQILYFAIEAIRVDDRVVLAVGDVPRAFINEMATQERGASARPFMYASMNGDAASRVLAVAVDQMANAEVLAGTDLAQFDRAVDQMAAYDFIRATGIFEGNAIVFESLSTFDPEAMLEAISGR